MGMMNICVCGWYFRKSFMTALKQVSHRFPVAIVAHRMPPKHALDLAWVLKENVGLEWGAYNYFLMNLWDGQSSVLFIHDDTEVMDTRVFSRIAMIEADQAFIFNNGREAAYNSGGHGRAVFCSSKFLNVVKDSGGFWYDEGNKGFIAEGGYRTEKPPEGCMHHNAAMHRLMRDFAKWRKIDLGLEVRRQILMPDLFLGRRGKI